MAGIGNWLVSRRAARIALIAGLFPLGLLSTVSAAVVVFVAELRGWREAAVDAGVALAALVVVTLVLQGSVLPLISSAGLTWGAAAGLGGLAGAYGSLTLPIQAVIVVALVGVIVFGVVVGDPVVFWEQFIGQLTSELIDMGMQISDPEMLMPLAPMMTGAIGASAVVSVLLALLLGTWWASRAGGPEFRAMFTSIRLGYLIGGLAILAGLATLLGFGTLGQNLLLVVGVGFAFQGLSVVHWQAGARGWPAGYLAVVYLPLLLGPSVIVMELFALAAIGFADNWFGLRRAASPKD